MRIAKALAVLIAVMSAVSLAAPVDKKTERAWKANCASCHGADGKGQTEQGKKMEIADFSAAAWQKGITDEKIKTSILDGVKNGKKEMDPFKDKLKPDQVDALIGMVRSFGAQ